MTVRIDAADVANLVEAAAWTGGVLALVVIGLIFYLLVRPSRRARIERDDPIVAEEMLQLMERMESRLETLERAVRNKEADQVRPQPTGDGPALRRIK